MILFYYGSGLSISDPHHFAPDADSTFTLMRIRIRGSIVSLYGSIVSLHGSIEPPQLLAVDCYADPDSTFDFEVNPASQK